MVIPDEMEFAMRRIGAACLVAMCGMLAGAPARADWVPAFKANDTGGIVAYSLATELDARQRAVDHCAYYGKVVKFLAVEPHPGGYISFACRWVPYGAYARPLRSMY
jgi:sugar phosphate isomerase/epimerase